MDAYILKDGRVVQVPMAEAMLWFETNTSLRQIERTIIHASPGKYRNLDDAWDQDSKSGGEVSTVFLCFNHGFNDKNPVLFETMVFGGPFDGFQLRYSSIEEAKNGHRNTVRMVKNKAP